MNKSDLVEALATKTSVSKVAAAQSIEALVAIITTAVAKGDDVALAACRTWPEFRGADKLS
jgi:nucleoid DNA-binding protein